MRNIIIPDIKCFSPKEGDLLRGRSPVELAKQLVRAGAPLLTVVTEEKEFKGSLKLLSEIVAAVEGKVPVIRKDFINTREDLIATKNVGAKGVLLMYSCLDREKLSKLYYQATELGLIPLVEIHNEEELAFATELGARLIGINNRDILQLERDDGGVENTLRLIGLAPKGALIISESSFKKREDIEAAIEAGAAAVLVGTAILSAEDAVAEYKRLSRKTEVKICGLMNEESVAICERNGVDMLGFVVEYPKAVPWNLTRSMAAKLIRSIKTRAKKVIVTGGDIDKIEELVRGIKPDMLQLHYKETFEETAELCECLKESGIEIIKAVPMDANSRIEQFGTDDIRNIIMLLNELPIYGILLDERSSENAEGTGLRAPMADAVIAKELTKKRLMLAGGINADNVAEIIDKTGIKAIDIMSGVEDMPGQKSEEKLKMLMDIINKKQEEHIC